MTVKQISVFVENKIGNLAEVTKILADAGINLCAISLADTKNFGVLRLIVDDSYNAATALKEHGFIFSITPVLAVSVPDVPGGLYRILTLLEDNGINLEYLYDVNSQKMDSACLIFKVERPEDAGKTLTKHQVRLLCQEDLKSLI